MNIGYGFVMFLIGIIIFFWSLTLNGYIEKYKVLYSILGIILFFGGLFIMKHYTKIEFKEENK